MRTLLLAALTLAAAPGAFACAELEHASPRVGEAMTAAPRQISLDMSEKIDAKGAQISVDGGALAPVSVNGKRVSGPVKAPLAAGLHKVSWQVYSADGHLAAGDYTFEVRRP